MRPPLAVSLGDPAGVGPEIILAAWRARAPEGLAPFYVHGGEQVLREAAQKLGLDCQITSISSPDQAVSTFADALPVLSSGASPYQPGAPSEHGARLAYQSLRDATLAAQSGKASGIVTAPVAKSAIAAIADGFLGQTEWLANQCDLPHDQVVMMLAGPQLRTVPITIHCPLSQVPKRLTKDLILNRARITDKSLREDYGMPAPRLAFTGLNPHAGEDGHLGREEIEIIAPAIAQLQAEGINASGPYPADAMFAPHMRANYDVALAMYHDQALVPLKALDFDAGVNVTLGLPIVRTSPDHGTAFDIAGKGIANPGAMIAAIRMAGEVASRRAAASQ